MKRLTRRDFLRALGIGSVGAIWAAGCSSPASAPSPTAAAKAAPAAAPTAAAAAAQAAATSAPAVAKGATLHALIYPYPVTAAIRDMLSDYQKQTGVTVSWEEVPYDQLLAKQTAELISKAGRYDLYTASNSWVGALAGTDQLQPLDDLIAKAGTDLDWNDFLPAQRNMYTYKGHPYGIPISSNIYLTGYRTDVFSQQGIKVPALGQSFSMDEWAGVAKQLNANGHTGTVFVTQPNASCEQTWSVDLMTLGGRFFDEKLNPVFNSKEGVAAGEYLRELMNYAPKDMVRYQNQDAAQVVMSGDTLTHTHMWVSRISMVEDKAKSKVAGQMAWTTIEYSPQVSGQKIGLAPNDGWGLMIPKASKYQKEAFDFAVWAMTKENQTKYLMNTITPPSRTSVFAYPQAQQAYPWLPVMKTQLENTFDYPPIPEWPEIADKTGAALTASFSGQMSMKDALDQANSQVTSVLKEHNYPVGTWTGAKLPWQ